MAYCIQDDLSEYISDEALVQLTDDDDSGVIDAGNVSQCITGADAEIDGYLVGVYELPFSSTPALIKEISIKLTTLRLYQRRHRVPDWVEALAIEARETLKMLNERDVILDETESTSKRADVHATMNARVHTRPKWSGW